MRTLLPVSPGAMLDEECLEPPALTRYRLAKVIGIPPQRVGDLVMGKSAITADTDPRPCRYFGLGDGGWRRGRAAHDTASTPDAMQETLAGSARCALLPR